MGTKSRETIYGASVRAAAERAAEARKKADRLGVEAWNARMLGFKGPAQPSPTLGDALNAGFGYLEVKCPCVSHHLARKRDRHSLRTHSRNVQRAERAMQRTLVSRAEPERTCARYR
jgi:hypothetical protein